MTERPILFSGPMVRAILDGRKTQTRRVVKPQPEGEPRPLSEWSRGLAAACHDHSPASEKLVMHSKRLEGRIFPFTTPSGVLVSPTCPYGIPGDRLYVREAWRAGVTGILYRADDVCPSQQRWKPAIHMKRADSRLTLEVVNVRVERLGEINEEDAVAEGIKAFPVSPSKIPRMQFATLWDKINAKRAPWSSNPWVWRIEFKRS